MKTGMIKKISVLVLTGVIAIGASGCGNHYRKSQAHESAMAETETADHKKSAQIEEFTFEVPEDWERTENSKDTQRFYQTDKGQLVISIYKDDTDFSKKENWDDYIQIQIRDFDDFKMKSTKRYEEGIFKGVRFEGTFKNEGYHGRADYIIANAPDGYAFIIGMTDYPNNGADYSKIFSEVLSSFHKTDAQDK